MAVIDTRTRIVLAALQIWESQGETAITCRAIGKRAGVSGARVCQLFKTMDNLRAIVAKRAIQIQNQSIIHQMRASGHAALAQHDLPSVGK